MSFSGQHDTAKKEEPKHHQAHVAHGLLGAAAAFELESTRENHEKKEGKDVGYSTLKKLAAAAVGYEVTMLTESKGRDELSHLKESHEKKKQGDEEAAKQTQKKFCGPYKPAAEVVYEEGDAVEETYETTY